MNRPINQTAKRVNSALFWICLLFLVFYNGAAILVTVSQMTGSFWILRFILDFLAPVLFGLFVGIGVYSLFLVLREVSRIKGLILITLEILVTCLIFVVTPPTIDRVVFYWRFQDLQRVVSLIQEKHLQANSPISATSDQQTILLPQRYKHLSRTGEVAIERQGRGNSTTEAIVFPLRSDINFLDTDEIRLVYSFRQPRSMCAYPEPTLFKLKDNWFWQRNCEGRG